MNSEKLSLVKTQLQSGWVNFSFTKKDGSIREMIATTALELIPEEHHPKKKEVVEEEDTSFEVEKKVNPDPTVNVYEKDKGWRSFRISQLLKMDGVDE